MLKLLDNFCQLRGDSELMPPVPINLHFHTIVKYQQRYINMSIFNWNKYNKHQTAHKSNTVKTAQHRVTNNASTTHTME